MKLISWFNTLIAEFGFCNIKSLYDSLFTPKYGLLFITTSATLSFIEVWFGIADAILIVLLLLLKVELFTGIWAAKVEKQRIISKKLQRFILKTMVYFTFIMSFHILSCFARDFTQSVYKYMHSFTIFYFIFVHVKSIAENYSRITGNPVEFGEYIKKLNDRLFGKKPEK